MIDQELYERAFTIYGAKMEKPAEPTLEYFRVGYERLLSRFTPAEDVLVETTALADIRTLRIAIEGMATEPVVLYLHGGGYFSGNPEGVADLCSRIARAARAEVYAPAYRLAPEAPFPAAVDDAVACYQALLEAGHGSDSIVIMGDSGGGGLAVATALALREAGVALPAAVVCYSPMVDLEATSETFETKADVDPVSLRSSVLLSAKLYLNGQDPRNPLASPLYADLAGLPPLMIQAGSEECLLGDAIRLAGRAAEARVWVRLEVEPGLPHVFQYFASFIPASQEAIERSAAFVTRWTSTPGSE